MRKIEVVDYDSSWPDIFQAESGLLLRVLEGVAVSIHHIGSTAVQGLAAKPVIDILVEVTELELLDNLRGELTGIGYESMGESGITGRRHFQKGDDERTHHIHAFECGDPNLIRHIAFRDYLRANPTAANGYGALKKQVAMECNHNIARYCDGKEPFVKRIEALALGEATADIVGE